MSKNVNGKLKFATVKKEKEISRRSFFIQTGAATAAVAALGGFATNDDYEAVYGNVNTNSQPSDLRITDMRTQGHFIRIDTNQGVSGYGEIRDSSSITYALMLKSRILGENPLNVDKIWRKLKQYGGNARQGAGPASSGGSPKDGRCRNWRTKSRIRRLRPH